MKGLNRIFRDVDTVRDKCLEILPKESGSINNVFNSLLQIFENLSYEDKRGNKKRYKGMKEDVPVESVLTILYETLNKSKLSKIDEVDNFLILLDAKIDHIQWDITAAKSSLRKLLTKLDKKLE